MQKAIPILIAISLAAIAAASAVRLRGFYDEGRKTPVPVPLTRAPAVEVPLDAVGAAHSSTVTDPVPSASDPGSGEFTQLAEALKAPSTVRRLVISEEIGELPAAIAGFVNLQVLEVRAPLSRLPPEIAALVSLQELTLYCTGIADLPVELTRLPNLRMLAFGGDFECDHPPVLSPASRAVLGTLTGLRALNLNFFTEFQFPNEILALTGLRVLNLEFNGLETLPEEISRLSSLELLRVSNNALKDLPASLSALKTLRVLEVGGNLFARLPPVLLQLKGLKTLDLRGDNADSITLEKSELDRVAAALPGVTIVPP